MSDLGQVDRWDYLPNGYMDRKVGRQVDEKLGGIAAPRIELTCNSSRWKVPGHGDLLWTVASRERRRHDPTCRLLPRAIE